MSEDKRRDVLCAAFTEASKSRDPHAISGAAYDVGSYDGESETVARIVEALRAEPWGADPSGKTIVPSLGTIADWIERGDWREVK